MANNLINHLRNTQITWLSTGGSKVITLNNTTLASGAGRQGAEHDFTAGSIEQEYEWRAVLQFNTAPVVGELVYIYWKSSDGNHYDNDDGTADAAVSAVDKVRNLTQLGAIEVDEAAAATDMVASGRMLLPARYGMPVFWNATADAAHATAANNEFRMTPIAPEIE